MWIALKYPRQQCFQFRPQCAISHCRSFREAKDSSALWLRPMEAIKISLLIRCILLTSQYEQNTTKVMKNKLKTKSYSFSKGKDWKFNFSIPMRKSDKYIQKRNKMGVLEASVPRLVWARASAETKESFQRKWPWCAYRGVCFPLSMAIGE